jgi:hypothetical protein
VPGHLNRGCLSKLVDGKDVTLEEAAQLSCWRLRKYATSRTRICQQRSWPPSSFVMALTHSCTPQQSLTSAVAESLACCLQRSPPRCPRRRSRVWRPAWSGCARCAGRATTCSCPCSSTPSTSLSRYLPLPWCHFSSKPLIEGALTLLLHWGLKSITAKWEQHGCS